MQPAAGLRLLLAFSLSPLLVVPATAQPRDDSANALTRDSIAAQLEALRNVRLDITERQTHDSYVNAHHNLLGLYWSQVAEDRVEHLPPVTLLRGGTRFSACGKSLRRNAYCPESNEISLSTTGMQHTQRFSETREQLLALTVLAHEWGHHVNHHSTRGSYSRREEDAADWRAGRYLAWLMRNDALDVKAFTDAANLFFSIGDFHLNSPHNNPKARYQAFIAGVAEDWTPGMIHGGWAMDTPETFSRVTNRRGSTSGSPRQLTAEVYRFEIERGGQIAGNLFSAFLGVVRCGIGSPSSCANALQQQGQAKPDGWYRLRTMRIDCRRGTFDIDGDGIRRQPLNSDRKNQAAVIAARSCQPRRGQPELDAS